MEVHFASTVKLTDQYWQKFGPFGDNNTHHVAVLQLLTSCRWQYHIF